MSGVFHTYLVAVKRVLIRRFWGLRVILIGELFPIISNFVSSNFSIFHIFLIFISKHVNVNKPDFFASG